MSSSFITNEAWHHMPGTEVSLQWRSSRHARRLLTLGLAGLFIATLARRPEFAGLAAPALLLLGAGRSQRRPPQVCVRVRPSSRRAFEGELVALDVAIEGIQVCAAGAAIDYDEPALARAVAREEVEYEVTLPGASGHGAETEVFFSDLSKEYVSMNADYTT